MKTFLAAVCLFLLNLTSLAGGAESQNNIIGEGIISIVKFKIETKINSSLILASLRNSRIDQNTYYWNSGLGNANTDFVYKIKIIQDACEYLQCDQGLLETYVKELKQNHDQNIKSRFSRYFELKDESETIEKKVMQETLPYGLALFADANDDKKLDEYELKILFTALGMDFVAGQSDENYADIILSATPKHSTELMRAIYKKMFALDRRYEFVSFDDADEIKEFRIKLGIY